MNVMSGYVTRSVWPRRLRALFLQACDIVYQHGHESVFRNVRARETTAVLERARGCGV